MTHQVCNCCGQNKPIIEFPKDNHLKSGYRTQCKSCIKVQRQEYYQKNKDKNRETTYKWREENRQYYLDYMKHTRGDNPNFIRKEKKYKRTPEESVEHRKQKEKEYRDSHKDQMRIWRKENKEELNAKRREHINNRRASDPCYRIQCNLRDRVKKLTKEQDTQRLAEYDELFGCSIEQYRVWIESHWLDGMNWGNWGIGEGKWNLDHHYPLSMFDLTQRDQQIIAMHYTNTYPMWAKDNLLKRDSIPSSPRENLYIPDFPKTQEKSI